MWESFVNCVVQMSVANALCMIIMEKPPTPAHFPSPLPSPSQAATSTTTQLHTQITTLTQELTDTHTAAAETCTQLHTAQHTIAAQTEELVKLREEVVNLRDEISTLQQVLHEETSGGRKLQQQVCEGGGRISVCVCVLL